MTRYVVLGAGAIGGVIGARLHQAGHDVLLVARGAHGATIAERGLRLDTPEGSTTLAVPVLDRLEPGALGRDDVVLLATKSQDSGAALDQLSAAGGPTVPVVCAQNGLDNERQALRRFERVYAMLVVVPATHVEPGVVRASAAPCYGILDLARFPAGADELSHGLAGALSSAGFVSAALEDAMPWKRAKLLANLANALQALAGVEADTADLASLARDEGRACFEAAGLPVVHEDAFGERIRPLRSQQTTGAHRGGGSSWQSLARRLPSIETDYLNGEIVLLGRLHGVATPVNALLQEVANALAAGRRPPGTIEAKELLQMLEDQEPK